MGLPKGHFSHVFIDEAAQVRLGSTVPTHTHSHTHTHTHTHTHSLTHTHTHTLSLSHTHTHTLSLSLSLSFSHTHTHTHTLTHTHTQALEAETLVPLSLANERTKIVLAGDHMQMDPPVYSDIAKKYGLQISLLERLYDHEAYDTGVGQLCKTLLTENHRSHQQVGWEWDGLTGRWAGNGTVSPAGGLGMGRSHRQVGWEWDGLTGRWAGNGTVSPAGGLGMGRSHRQVGWEWDGLTGRWAGNGTAL